MSVNNPKVKVADRFLSLDGEKDFSIRALGITKAGKVS